MRALLALPLLALVQLPLATPSFAQTMPSVDASSTQPDKAPPSPAHLAIAQKITAQLWPEDVMRKVPHDEIEAIADDLIQKDMYDLASQWNPNAAVNGTLTIELDKDNDPHYAKRRKAAIAIIEPQWKIRIEKYNNAFSNAFSVALANRFSQAQLVELNRMFNSPTGQAFAQSWIPLIRDTNMQVEVMSYDLIPETWTSAPENITRYRKATANLPPPRFVGDPPDVETEHFQDNWSETDIQKLDELFEQKNLANQKSDETSQRITLHTYESKLRAGKSLTPVEMEELKFLREQYREKP